MTAQYPYDLTGTERKPNARAVRLLQERTISLSFLPSKTVRFLHNQRAGIVRCHLRRFYGLTILHKSSETKRKSRPPLASARRPHGNGDTCRLRSRWTHRRPNVNQAYCSKLTEPRRQPPGSSLVADTRHGHGRKILREVSIAKKDDPVVRLTSLESSIDSSQYYKLL